MINSLAGLLVLMCAMSAGVFAQSPANRSPTAAKNEACGWGFALTRGSRVKAATISVNSAGSESGGNRRLPACAAPFLGLTPSVVPLPFADDFMSLPGYRKNGSGTVA